MCDGRTVGMVGNVRCLAALPGFAWVLLNNICIQLLSALYFFQNAKNISISLFAYSIDGASLVAP